MKKLLLLLIVVGIIAVIVMNKSDKKKDEGSGWPERERIKVEEKTGIVAPDINLP